jgi:hypothetical protein
LRFAEGLEPWARRSDRPKRRSASTLN